MAERRSFFAKLFDISFSEFISVQIIGILYALGILAAGLLALGLIIGGFSQGALAGISALLFSPLIFLLYVILVRIGLEAFLASIKTSENTRRILEKMNRSEL